MLTPPRLKGYLAHAMGAWFRAGGEALDTSPDAVLAMARAMRFGTMPIPGWPEPIEGVLLIEPTNYIREVDRIHVIVEFNVRMASGHSQCISLRFRGWETPDLWEVGPVDRYDDLPATLSLGLRPTRYEPRRIEAASITRRLIDRANKAAKRNQTKFMSDTRVCARDLERPEFCAWKPGTFLLGWKIIPELALLTVVNRQDIERENPGGPMVGTSWFDFFFYSQYDYTQSRVSEVCTTPTFSARVFAHKVQSSDRGRPLQGYSSIYRFLLGEVIMFDEIEPMQRDYIVESLFPDTYQKKEELPISLALPSLVRI